MQIVNAGLKCETVSHLGFRGALEYLADLKKEEEEAVLADERPDLSRQDHIQTAIAANQLAEQHRKLLATGQTLRLGGAVFRQVPSPVMIGPIRLAPSRASPPDAPDARKVWAHTIAFAEFIQSAEIDPCELWHDLSEIETHKLSNALLAILQWLDATEKAKP